MSPQAQAYEHLVPSWWLALFKGFTQYILAGGSTSPEVGQESIERMAFTALSLLGACR